MTMDVPIVIGFWASGAGGPRGWSGAMTMELLAMTMGSLIVIGFWSYVCSVLCSADDPPMTIMTIMTIVPPCTWRVLRGSQRGSCSEYRLQ